MFLTAMVPVDFSRSTWLFINELVSTNGHFSTDCVCMTNVSTASTTPELWFVFWWTFCNPRCFAKMKKVIICTQRTPRGASLLTNPDSLNATWRHWMYQGAKLLTHHHHKLTLTFKWPPSTRLLGGDWFPFQLIFTGLPEGKIQSGGSCTIWRNICVHHQAIQSAVIQHHMQCTDLD